MGAMDHSLMVANESTYNTPVTVTRSFEYESESIEEQEGRTQGDPLRAGSGVVRSDRHTPYFMGASGSVELAVLTKGFGFWNRHLLGVNTTGTVSDSVYTHTATEGELLGDSFTMQINRPFHPAGTNQAFTYAGCKIPSWALNNTVDGNLLMTLNIDAAQVSTATALATAAYPSSMDNFSWAKGVVSIGGSDYDVTEIGIEWDNGMNVERRQIRGNTDKKEPTAGRRSGKVTIKADFESLTQRNRAHVTARTTSQVIATWTGPTLAGVSAYPQFIATMPAIRWDAWKGATEGPEGIEQELTGEILFDGTNSPITLAVKNTDSTA